MDAATGIPERYRVVARLGAIAGAERLRARDPDGVEVDLDVLPPEVRDLAEYDRAVDDLRIAAAVHHPHLVDVREVVPDEGPAPFVVREAVDGSWLGALVPPDGMEDPGHALDLVADVAEALGALHRAGLAHGDVGSGRVRLDRGVARLADTGVGPRLAAAVGPDAPSDGTPVIRPVPADDVHGLAVLAWRMLTGSAPPPGGGDVRELRDDVPVRAAETLARALGDDLDARPVTVGTLARDLGRPRPIPGPRSASPVEVETGPSARRDDVSVTGGGRPAPEATDGTRRDDRFVRTRTLVALGLLLLAVVLALAVQV